MKRKTWQCVLEIIRINKNEHSSIQKKKKKKKKKKFGLISTNP